MCKLAEEKEELAFGEGDKEFATEDSLPNGFGPLLEDVNKHYDYILLPKKMQSLTIGPAPAKTPRSTSQLDVMFPMKQLKKQTMEIKEEATLDAVA